MTGGEDVADCFYMTEISLPEGWKWYGTNMDYFRQEYFYLIKTEGRRCYRIVATVDHDRITSKILAKENFRRENVEQIVDKVAEFCAAYWKMKREVNS